MDTSDLKKGLKFMYDGQPWVCVDFQFVKPGKGQAFTRTKMRHLLTGSTVEKNIRSNEKIEPADAEDRTCSTSIKTATPTFSCISSPATRFPCRKMRWARTLISWSMASSA